MDMPDSETDPVVVNSSHTLLFVVSDSDSDDSGEVIDVDPDRLAPTDIEADIAGPQPTEGPDVNGTAAPSGGVLLKHDHSPSADFRPPKRFKPAPPEDDSDDDRDNCPICFETWNNSGIHRLVALKCGHLFGQSCIEKWIKKQKAKCPQCNMSVTKKDIRPIYAKTLRVTDTSERDRALAELGMERAARRKAELEMAQMRLRYEIVAEECATIKKELDRRQRDVGGAGAARSVQRDLAAHFKSLTPTYVCVKELNISECGGSRIMTYHGPLATLCVSQPSHSHLFPWYGIKKLNCVDFKPTEFVRIHSKVVRDLAVNPDGLLLSCSIDKTVKLTSLLSNATVQSYTTPVPVWSCEWDADDPNYFYAGLTGTVRVFDMRNTSVHVQDVVPKGTRSPVIALRHVSRDLQSAFRSSGLLVGQLDQVSFFEKTVTSNDFKPHLLPIHGNLTSLSVDPKSRHFLATFRPVPKTPCVRHKLCELTKGVAATMTSIMDNHEGCSCNVVNTFHGGSLHKLLTRSKLVAHPSNPDHLLVCAGDEASSSVNIWNVGNGHKMQKLPTETTVVDICPVDVNNDHFLACLKDKQVIVYKWQ